MERLGVTEEALLSCLTITELQHATEFYAHKQTAAYLRDHMLPSVQRFSSRHFLGWILRRNDIGYHLWEIGVLRATHCQFVVMSTRAVTTGEFSELHLEIRSHVGPQGGKRFMAYFNSHKDTCDVKTVSMHFSDFLELSQLMEVCCFGGKTARQYAARDAAELMISEYMFQALASSRYCKQGALRLIDILTNDALEISKWYRGFL